MSPYFWTGSCGRLCSEGKNNGKNKALPGLSGQEGGLLCLDWIVCLI